MPPAHIVGDTPPARQISLANSGLLLSVLSVMPLFNNSIINPLISGIFLMIKSSRTFAPKDEVNKDVKMTINANFFITQ